MQAAVAETGLTDRCPRRENIEVHPDLLKTGKQKRRVNTSTKMPRPRQFGRESKPKENPFPSTWRCIVCYSRKTHDPTDDLSPNVSNVKLLHALSKALRVSDTLYSNLDLSTLPSIPFCSDCSFLIYDAVRILKEIRKLERNWASIADVLKDNIRDSYRRHSSHDGESVRSFPDHPDAMESIRKTIAQCFTTCNVNIGSKDGRNDKEGATIVRTGSENVMKQESVESLVLSDDSNFDYNDPEIKFDGTNDENQAPFQEDLTASFEGIMENLANDFAETEDSLAGNFLEEIEDDPAGGKVETTDSALQKNTNNSEIQIDRASKGTSNILQCRFCPQAYFLKSYLEAHERQHEGKLSVECQKCHRGFVTLRSLRLHQSLHRNCHVQKSQQASQRTRLDPKRKTHVTLLHSTKTSRTMFKGSLTSFNCQQCKKDFVKENYRDEGGCHVFRCEIPACGKFFHNFSLFRRHHELTCPDRRRRDFKCEYCDRAFTTNCNLTSHVIALHTKNFKYICELCGHGAVNPSRLRKHMLTHTDEKPFHCNLCSKTFKRKVQLDFHLRRHRKEFPYLCDACGKRFINLQLLRIHETTHREEKKFPCPICNKLFISKSYVHNHIQGFHRKSRKPR